MSSLRNSPPPVTVSTQRRRLLGALGAGALGAGALGASLGGCAAPTTTTELRPLDTALAPRAGDTWRYAFKSVFRLLASRTLEVQALEVRVDDLSDRITGEGEAETEDHLFTSALEMVERPVGPVRRVMDRIVPRLTVIEFAPYLQAYGELPEEGRMVIARPVFGGPFTGRARRRGSEQVTVPAGTFEAVRMDYEFSRSPAPTMRPRLDPAAGLGTVWYAPAVKRPVRWTVVMRAAQRDVLVDDTYELESYRVA